MSSGTGQVTGRGFNHIDVVNAFGPALVLRYHWIPGLRTNPPALVEPQVTAEGFPPLVKIIGPPEKFTLSTCVKCDAVWSTKHEPALISATKQTEAAADLQLTKVTAP